VKRLVQIAVDADGDPGILRLDAGPFDGHVFDDLDGDIHLLVRGLERGQIDLAVTLRRMRIACPQQRALDEYRDIERSAFGEIADIDVTGVASRRHRAVLAGLGTRDTQRARERRQRNLDPGREFGDLAFEVEVEILDLSLRKLAGKLAE